MPHIYARNVKHNIVHVSNDKPIKKVSTPFSSKLKESFLFFSTKETMDIIKPNFSI